MNDDDDHDLDRQVSEAVSVDAASVARIVAASLRPTAARRRTAARLAACAAIAGLIVAAVVLTWPARPDPSGVIRMRNVGDVIFVDYPDGSRSIIGPAKPDHELFAGFNYVLVEGERQ